MHVDRDKDGFENEWYWDDQAKKVHLKRYQYVDENLEANLQEYNAHSDYKPYSNVKGGLFKYASIPNGLVEQWMKEGFNVYNCDNKDLKKRLNSPDFKKLRTMPGRI